MTARLVVLTGTGTGIGKTHFGEALLRAAGQAGLRAAGLKPVESGVGEGTTDAARLAAASTFHVKHEGLAFALPVSPHLAARAAGVALDLGPLVAWIGRVRAGADLVLVELPGGLFSPLVAPPDGALLVNADLAARLAPDAVALYAPDRLGVLHDVGAATRAAAGVPLRIDLVVLGAPEVPDASTGTNAGELRAIVAPPVLGPVPRGTPEELAEGPVIRAALAGLAGPAAANEGPPEHRTR